MEGYDGYGGNTSSQRGCRSIDMVVLHDIWRCKRLRCVLEGSIWSLRVIDMMVYDGYGGYSCSQRVRWSLREVAGYLYTRMVSTRL